MTLPARLIRLTRLTGPAVRAEILRELPAFWAERDVQALHHPVWWHQFAADALTIREDGVLLAYLAGTVPVNGPAYVHLVATRIGRQGEGLGRRLYTAFMANSSAAGAEAVEAITQPANPGSLAFHRRLGFDATLVPDYASPGQPRILFRRPLP